MRVKVTVKLDIDTALFKKQRIYIEKMLAEQKCDELVGLSHITDFIADTMVDEYAVPEEEVLLLDKENDWRS